MSSAAAVYRTPPPAMDGDALKAWARRLCLSPDAAAAVLALSPSGYRNQAYGHRPVSAQTARIAELVEALKT